jgi:hypothetical protein
MSSPDRQPAESTHTDGTHMTKTSRQKAAFVFTKEETGPGGTATVQLAVPIPRGVSRWFRHFALDHNLSMAELVRRILSEFMAAHGERK